MLQSSWLAKHLKLMSHQEVIYQVDLDVEAGLGADFDAWLAGHVEEMLAIAGFVSAEILAEDEPDDSGRLQRTVLYRVANRAALEHYFTHDAERMRSKGNALFGKRFSARRRILSSSQELPNHSEVELLKSCRNCAEPLTGQYCQNCGQRDRNRMISLWELIRDLLGDLFEVDSRLWRSLIPLLVRPGKLTREYLAGRQVHYTPPLRMYLVLSILFFVIASIGNTNSRLTIDGEEVSSSTTDSVAAQQESVQQCNDLDINIGWEPLDKPETIARIRHICQRIVADQGRSFARSLYNNLPKMMFLFLPLMALVLKFLYIGSRRYYVEHLLFFVHFHSFFFLVLTLSILLARIPEFVPGQGTLTNLAIVAVSAYIPVYLFKALRRVYGQGFLFTLAKYCLLFIAYVVCLGFTMGIGLLLTALSV